MIFRFMLAVGLVALLIGCGQHGKPATTEVSSGPPTQENAQPIDSGQPARAAAAGATPESAAGSPQTSTPQTSEAVEPVVVPPDANLETTLAQLTQALRKFSMEHRRVPKSFSEIVAAGYVSGLPQPPRGKQFAVDVKHVQVVLVKQ